MSNSDFEGSHAVAALPLSGFCSPTTPIKGLKRKVGKASVSEPIDESRARVGGGGGLDAGIWVQAALSTHPQLEAVQHETGRGRGECYCTWRFWNPFQLQLLGVCEGPLVGMCEDLS